MNENKSLIAWDAIPDLAVELEKLPTGAWALRWSDGVANEWEEEFELLSVAFIRLASLSRCSESDWEKGFSLDAESHSIVADEILESLVE